MLSARHLTSALSACSTREYADRAKEGSAINIVAINARALIAHHIVRKWWDSVARSPPNPVQAARAISDALLSFASIVWTNCRSFLTGCLAKPLHFCRSLSPPQGFGGGAGIEAGSRQLIALRSSATLYLYPLTWNSCNSPIQLFNHWIRIEDQLVDVCGG